MQLLIPLLRFAGLIHLGFIAAGITMPRVTGLPQTLRILPPFPRQLFWMYYTFIAGCLICFGLGTFWLAPELAEGTLLARAVCGFMALFWSVRFLFALFVVDVKPFIQTPFHRIGYLLLNTAFLLLPLIYALAAFTGGRA
jgi:hypothetical protein